jgi:hypothetical protein
MVTAPGEASFADFGIDLHRHGNGKRAFCRPCLDWSERRPHLAGTVGAALTRRSFESGWVTRLRDTRALAISPRARRVRQDLRDRAERRDRRTGFSTPSEPDDQEGDCLWLPRLLHALDQRGVAARCCEMDMQVGGVGLGQEPLDGASSADPRSIPTQDHRFGIEVAHRQGA